ncbi:YceI family protein [Hyphobacterium sp.]|uniref:YceI family protein n=1 Tax=Hyphobacterium sp. TaxID=2004662 RepID=UPI003BA96E7D
MKFLTASAFAALTATAALADPIAYEFDRTHTEINASWIHLGLSRQSIQFTDYEGTLLLDMGTPSNSTVDVTFNLIDGFWVGAHHERFIAHLNSEDLFNTAEFPTAHFVATSFETEDGQTGTMTGDLTLLGNTGPVTLDVTLNGVNEERGLAGFTATTTILRSEWGLGYAVPAISDEIIITINTELELITGDAE